MYDNNKEMIFSYYYLFKEILLICNFYLYFVSMYFLYVKIIDYL